MLQLLNDSAFNRSDLNHSALRNVAPAVLPERKQRGKPQMRRILQTERFSKRAAMRDFSEIMQLAGIWKTAFQTASVGSMA
jgi:hypothetical protein